MGNKVVLYGAKTEREFKEKLKMYDSIKAKQVEVGHNSGRKQSGELFGKGRQHSAQTDRKDKTEEKTPRCFNCGMLGHKSNECKAKSQGAKCFRCNKFGHKGFQCTEERTKSGSHPADVKYLERHSFGKTSITVKSGNLKMDALIDTGSQINVGNA